MTALALGHRCALDEPDEHFYDHGLATNTIQRLQFAGKKLASDGTPFFIQSGFARPHTPWRVPSRFWDLYGPLNYTTVERRPALFFLGHISPIFAPFFLVFSRFSPS